MIELPVRAGDDADFLKVVTAIVLAVGVRCCPHDLIIVKIDSWFGPRWLGFEGKIVCGAVGSRNASLRVPPFTPARVRYEWALRVPSFEDRKRPRIHRRVRTTDAVWRRLDKVAPDTAIVWFSGASAANGRGSVMVYARERVDSYGWYAGWLRTDGTWLPTQLRDISRRELDILLHPPFTVVPGNVPFV